MSTGIIEVAIVLYLVYVLIKAEGGNSPEATNCKVLQKPERVRMYRLQINEGAMVALLVLFCH